MVLEHLSGVAFVIFVALGALLLILLFLFAKRQIMRFSLRSRRGPHMPVGHDAPRSLRKEIERRLDCIALIKYEPQLSTPDTNQSQSAKAPCYYRQKAMDDVKTLEREIRAIDPKACRHPGDNLRAFLLNQASNTLSACEVEEIHEYCDAYEHARYSPLEFGLQVYNKYKTFVDTFIARIRNSNLTKTGSSPVVKVSKPSKKER